MTAAVPFLVAAALYVPVDVPASVAQAVDDLVRRVGAEPKPAAVAPLHALGRPALAVLLDRVFPESARPFVGSPLAAALARGLVEKLSADDFDEREAATRRLIGLGRGVIPLVALAANQEGDPELKHRAKTVLKALGQSDRRDPPPVGVFRAYLQDVHDADRLAVVADRVADEATSYPQGPREAALTAAVRAVARSGDDAVCDRLAPALAAKDSQAAVFVVDRLGGNRPAEFYPRVLLDALGSDRQTVAVAAVGGSLNCYDKVRREEVRERLRKLFDGGPDWAKFAAARPLARDWADPDATAYLVTQLKGTDKGRAVTAAGWLGDPRPPGRPAPAGLVDAATPLLASSDPDLRRAGLVAVGSYGGEDVLRLVAAALTDKAPVIAAEASARLREHPDADAVRRLLAKEAAGDDPVRRDAARKVLAELTGG